MSVDLNTGENGRDNRLDAILNCYGATAIREEKSFSINNEEITFWMVHGFLELSDLQSAYTDEQIVAIYDSGE